MQLKNRQKRVWAEINQNAVQQNFQIIKGSLKKNTKLCCVIKANAYGHGAVQLAKQYESLGADWFAVSNIEEAIQLRQNSIKLPILVLGYTAVECASELASYDISQCVFSGDYGKALSDCAVAQNVSVKIHIKIDTGMGRIGFQCRKISDDENVDSLNAAIDVCRMKGLVPEGAFTHFAVADEGENGKSFTEAQFNNFMFAVSRIENSGVKFDIKHCANSAAIFDYPEFQLDMVRAGVVLYGMMPSACLKTKLPLVPVMTLKSVISHIKTIKKGDSVSYGRTYIAERDTRVATIPIGYADGFWRSNSTNRMKITVNGNQIPIIGRVCMDQLMLDISDVSDVKQGDEVIVFGTAPAFTADDVARINNTINYEITCAVGERVPRVYVKNGEITYLLDGILKNDD